MVVAGIEEKSVLHAHCIYALSHCLQQIELSLLYDCFILKD
jgi:hypothetical protein